MLHEHTIKKIAVIGGGNIGTQFAATCGFKGYEVNVYSSKPEKYGNSLIVEDGEGNITFEGAVSKVTDDLSEAVCGCDVVFITLPSFMFSDFARKLERFVVPGMYIGVIPGTGGAEFAFANCMKAGAKVFGIQRVPCVARLREYGRSVCVEGKRDKLHLASIPKEYSPVLAHFIADLFDMPCEILDNYLCVTMTPSNPILHTTRLCSMFSDYVPGKIYDRNPLFYGEWTQESSELLFACDTEHQNMLAAINNLDLREVRSLKLHYESETPVQLTAKIRSIKSLHNLSSPMKREGDGWVPDFDSRYFTADFPYGLAIIEQIAKVVDVRVPNISKTLEWYYSVTGRSNQFVLSDYGIHSLDDIYHLYQ